MLTEEAEDGGLGEWKVVDRVVQGEEAHESKQRPQYQPAPDCGMS
jgi:hypothetical protein